MAVITGIIVLTVSGMAFAQMQDKGKEMMGGKGMMGMMAMCHSMMNKPSMVAVGDDIVVLSGKKLYKYDSNFNLVKEADIKAEDMGMMGGVDADEHAVHHPEQK